MGQRRHQTYGPDDTVRWMSNGHPAQLPWREFTLNSQSSTKTRDAMLGTGHSVMIGGGDEARL